MVLFCFISLFVMYAIAHNFKHSDTAPGSLQGFCIYPADKCNCWHFTIYEQDKCEQDECGVYLLLNTWSSFSSLFMSLFVISALAKIFVHFIKNLRV